jgi:TolA-binding protein
LAAFGTPYLTTALHVASAEARALPTLNTSPSWEPDTIPRSLFRQALKNFKGDDMPGAEAGFRATLDHGDTDTQLRNDALFYLIGAVHRQARHSEVVELANRWLVQNPKDSSRDYVLLFQGLSHKQLKDTASARACWEEIMAADPGSNLSNHARELLNGLKQNEGQDQKADAAQRYQKALADFFETKDMTAAEKGFREVLDDKDIDPELRKMALFYLSAAVHRQDKHAEYVKLTDQWLKAHPKEKSRNYVLLFKGISHERLQELEKAKSCWKEIVTSEPDSDLAEHAKQHLDMLGGGEAQPRAPRGRSSDTYQPRRVLPASAGKPGGYVVVTVALNEKDAEDITFAAVARKVAAFHRGEVIPFDGKDFDALAQALKQRTPKNVLFVIPPARLDINLHRRILLLSASLDEDIFPDFSFGYFTARDGAALEKLWQRTEGLHKNGLKSRTWLGTAVTSGMKSTVYPDYIPEAARAAGFKGQTYFLACIESDPDVLKFADEHLPKLKDAGVLCLSGNGDPEGIWLFDDKRNADRAKHWRYDPAKVGHDPKGEMPRLTAERWSQVQLQSPVVWSGTCHAAAPRRVFVEGDIVSTFGTTDKATVHLLDPKKSLCLAIIDAGAVAFLAPIAANHGFSTLCEQNFALTHGATLGETIKSTYDDVFLASRGKLHLDIQVEGEKHRDGEQVMQGGGANRILIGDPALAPFNATPHPTEKVEIRNRTDRGFSVIVTWDAGFHAGAWDIYGSDRQHDHRIGVRIPFDDLAREGQKTTISATVKAQDKESTELPFVMKHAEPEVHHGRRYLHLQANAARKSVERKFVQATFSVTVE